MVQASNTNPKIRVVPYSPSNLRRLLRESEAQPTEELLKSKLQLTYLYEYFDYLKAQTIVVEPNYTDRDYLEDFAAFYVRCFHNYSSQCLRLHFFDVAFSEAALRAATLSKPSDINEDKLNAHYLGFVVIKPLPIAFIGRTCLTTYPKSGSRHFPTTREYNSHIFGFNLSVDSLAFQEQDTVAAACATSALWSAFQATGKLFQHEIPSPVVITENATRHSTSASRDFPNNGLSVEQMGHAVKQIGLEPSYTGVASESHLQSLAYAYLKAEIPLLMMVMLIDISDLNNITYKDGDRDSSGHAVAITGYNLGRRTCRPDPIGDTLFTSSRIDKLYVHDDGVGPFARNKFRAGSIPVTDKNYQTHTAYLTLSSSWAGTSGNIGSMIFEPFAVIIPLYHKIRLTLEVVKNTIRDYDGKVEANRYQNLSKFPRRLEWDLFLSTGGDVKRDVRVSCRLPIRELSSTLEKPLPRFVWRAIAKIGAKPVLEILYDATDISNGMYFLDCLIYETSIIPILPNP